MSAEESTQFRFVVRSADEAVKVLRERLGEHARVISVRQVEGAGLSRFLSAPKLEVVAEIVPPTPEAPVPEAAVEPEPTAIIEPVPAPEPAPVVAQTPIWIEPTPTEEPAPEEGAARMLSKAGIPAPVLASLAAQDWWAGLEGLPFRAASSDIVLHLQDIYERQPKAPVTNRIAFFGTAGVGKTTALCKHLAQDVFLHRRPSCVWKVDTARANPADGLSVFCEALGVPLLRTSEEVAARPAHETLFLDLPGLQLGDLSDFDHIDFVLAQYEITTRVLVVSAAYDASLIKAAYRTGADLGATHVVFTHLDELPRWGKLWDFVLRGGLTPLFFSAGPNIAGDMIDKPFYALAQRTIPQSGSETAMEMAHA